MATTKAYDRMSSEKKKQLFKQKIAYQKALPQHIRSKIWKTKLEYQKNIKTAAYRAKTRLAAAVYKGRIVKPPECLICGNEAKIEAHHEDYSRPFDVIWCCRVCHRVIHKYMKLRTGVMVGSTELRRSV